MLVMKKKIWSQRERFVFRHEKGDDRMIILKILPVIGRIVVISSGFMMTLMINSQYDWARTTMVCDDSSCNVVVTMSY